MSVMTQEVSDQVIVVVKLAAWEDAGDTSEDKTVRKWQIAGGKGPDVISDQIVFI